jgi:PAS domain S-box-containing protein
MVTDPEKATIPDDVFVGGGEMGALMRSLDWSQTLLGPLAGWAQSLKTAVSILLNSRYPMFVWWGPDYANLYNDAYRPILGSSKHPQFLGQSAKDCWAEIWDVVGTLAESVRKTGEPTWSEDLLLMMDRYGYLEETYFTFSYSPVQDESGGVGGVFCACIETTERIVGERRLRTLRELAANTTEAKNVEDACHITTNTLASNPHDIPFALLYIVEDNGRQARLVGATGIAIGTVASPKQIDLTQKAKVWNFNQVNTTGKAELVDDLIARFGPLLGVTREESPQAALVMPIEQSGQKQQLAGFLVLGISPRRKFDDEYRGFFDLIVGNVATAITNTRAYEEERRRAEALAELDRAKTVFFSNVSHELRTPLTLILSPLEEMLTVSDDTPFATQRQQVEMVQRNALRLRKLVNTLLDFTRIEAGRDQAVYEATDLTTFTRDLASLFRSAVEQAGLCFTVDCPSLPEPIYIDRGMWENIVLNLLSNAFKFTFKGRIIVNLRWAEKQVELSVQDTGIGIPPEEIPKLFERFHRVKGAQGRSIEGSGIGLSLVQELVRLHSGTVKVTSILGQGSCFTVSIPTGYAHLPQDRVSLTQTPVTPMVSEASAYVEEALRWLPEEVEEQGRPCGLGEPVRSWGLVPLPSSRETRPQGWLPKWSNWRGFPQEQLLSSRGVREKDDSKVSPLTSSARIFLVDDNADMRQYVKRLLISNHYDVQAVPDGVAALAAIRQNRPDLVLSDVMMPGLDGFGLLRELRSNLETRDIPIILLSARAGEESCVEGLEAGADDYLIKPFSARELLARVESNIKMSRLRRETAQREMVLRGEAQTARNQTRNILETVTDAFVAFDNQWRYTYVNRAATLLLQRSSEELIGKNVWEEVFPSEVGGLAYRELHRAVAQQVPVSWEEFGQPIQRWLEVKAYPSGNEVAVYFRDITERKQAEAERERLLSELETERTRLKAVLRQMPAGVMIADAATDKLVLANEQVEHIVGYSYQLDHQLEEYEQLVQFSGFHPNGRRYAPDEWPLMRSLRTGEVISGEEIELERGDGSRIFIETNAAPILDSQGQIVAAVVVFQDITKRKSAEQALRESEDRLRLALEASNLGMWHWDVKRNILTWTDKCKALFGLPSTTEMSYEVFLTAVHPEDRQQTHAAVTHAIHDQVDYDIEYRALWPDGTVHWIAAKGRCTYDSTGQATRMMGVAIDISERKATEAAIIALNQDLQNRVNDLQTLFEVIPIGILITQDLNFRRIEANPAFAEILDILPGGNASYTPQNDTSPVPYKILRNGKELTGDEIPLRRAAIHNIKVENVEVDILRLKDGAVFNLYGYAAPLRNEQGKVRGVVGAFVDITERKQAEKEREELLSREQAARAEAEAANRIKDEFLAVLSHELRSPLNPILGWTRLLRSGKLDQKKTAHALEVIERNAKLQTQLIEDLLDVSRILRGKLRLEMTPVNLVAIIEAAIETVHLAAQAKSIQIQTVFNPNVGMVLGDTARLQQVIWNLLSNAVKFTDSGGRVDIRLEFMDSYAQIKVSDTGKGIHPNFLPHVFEYFRQADATTTRKFGGLGLGLAIVRHLVELHGGTVLAESPGEGKGATFTVTLALLENKDTDIIKDEDSPSITKLNSSPLAGIQVLVVDDDPDARELIGFILEQQGAIITRAVCALEALQILAETKLDVLISDIGMPDIDGYTLMRKIRAMSNQNSQILAIALTAYAGEINQKQAIDAGFKHHITKPVDAEQLVQVITTEFSANLDSCRR